MLAKDSLFSKIDFLLEKPRQLTYIYAVRKEVVFAIFAGTFLGLVIAFGLWRANSVFSPRSPKTQGSPSPTPKPEFLLTLAKPQEKDVVTQSSVAISGVTKANAKVAVATEEEDYLTRADANGSFEEEVELTGGVNQLIVTAFDDTGASATQKITLVYSSEFSKYELSESSQETGTDEADSIRERVQKKVEEVLKKPTAYIGVITDISETTLQIKNEAGIIQQISVNSDTSYVKVAKTSKEVKFSDLAIGDFIVSMGFKNGMEVLSGKRILITSPVEPSNKKAVMGKVAKIEKGKIIIQLPKTDEDFQILTDSSVSYFSFQDSKVTKAKSSQLDEEQTIIVSGQEDEKGFDTRSVFIIQ